MSEAVYEMGAIAGPPCVSAYRETMRWLRKHPEIDFVITTAEVDKGLPGPASTIESRKLRGFQQTFRRFPRNVRRVIVLRDTPNATGTTFDCLDRVVRAGLRARRPAVRHPAPAGAAGCRCRVQRRALHVRAPLPGGGHDRPHVLADRLLSGARRRAAQLRRRAGT